VAHLLFSSFSLHRLPPFPTQKQSLPLSGMFPKAAHGYCPRYYFPLVLQQRGSLLLRVPLDTPAVGCCVLDIGLVCRFSDLFLVSKPVFFLTDALESDESWQVKYIWSQVSTFVFTKLTGGESTWKVRYVSFYWFILWLICFFFFIHVWNTCKCWLTWTCWQHTLEAETPRF